MTEPTFDDLMKPSPEACPKCGGSMWDNRIGKKNRRAPDFRCMDKYCDGVRWPEKSK